MRYPAPLFDGTLGRPVPILGDRMKTGKPFVLRLGSAENDDDAQGQEAIQRILLGRMADGYAYGIGEYLDYRASMLRPYPQMRETQRYFHLGIDLAAPAGTPVFAPVPGDVIESGYEDGPGNYGGYAVLHHGSGASTFFTLYGHLDPELLPAKGHRLEAGAVVGFMGEFGVNGNWFTHTHVQVLTERGFLEGWLHKGYCTASDLSFIRAVCPDPTFLWLAGILPPSA